MSLKRSPKGVQRAYKFYNKYLKIEKQKLKTFSNNRVIKTARKIKTFIIIDCGY